MNRNYWEKIAPSYNEEIFDVLDNDKKKIIGSAIRKYSSLSKTAIDLGSAIGKWLPLLSPIFKEVYAVDISARNLEIAKKNYPQYKNVKYLRADLSGKKTKLPKSDLAICINAILTSSLKSRTNFFNTLATSVKKNGYLVLVVPSLESYLLTSVIANQWKIDQDVLNRKFSTGKLKSKWENIKQGNADIDNVPTKHYLKEELQLLLSNEGFKVETVQKIEYDWKTEFNNPPKWLKDPYPWDWMAVAKKSNR